jgi:hypothetical protein
MIAAANGGLGKSPLRLAPFAGKLKLVKSGAVWAAQPPPRTVRDFA